MSTDESVGPYPTAVQTDVDLHSHLDVQTTLDAECTALERDTLVVVMGSADPTIERVQTQLQAIRPDVTTEDCRVVLDELASRGLCESVSIAGAETWRLTDAGEMAVYERADLLSTVLFGPVE